jgi:hypothetical protein
MPSCPSWHVDPLYKALTHIAGLYVNLLACEYSVEYYEACFVVQYSRYNVCMAGLV